jgi:hypothetical protein
LKVRHGGVAVNVKLASGYTKDTGSALIACLTISQRGHQSFARTPIRK